MGKRRQLLSVLLVGLFLVLGIFVITGCNDNGDSRNGPPPSHQDSHSGGGCH